MRIVILTNDYPPNIRGGAGVIAYEHAEGLKRRSHDVVVIHAPTRFISKGSLYRLCAHLFDLRSRPDLVTRIMTAKPDILLTHSITGCGFGTPRAVQATGVPWVHVLHDVQLVEPSGQIVYGESFSKVRACWRWGWSHVRRVFFGTPSTVLSPSEWLLFFHLRNGFFAHSSTHILPNPLPKFANNERDSTFDISSNDFLYVGRLDADKGVQILIDAWERLGDERPRLHLVGEGSLRKSIEQKMDSKIVVHGQLDHHLVQELYSQLPTVIVPSIVYENQPTVILEALSSGCRVIASGIGGIPELISDQDLCEPENVDDLFEKISKMRRISEHERNKARSKHHSETVLDALESILKSNL